MRLLLFVAVLLAAAAQAQPRSDWEREQEERLKQTGENPVPPPPLDRARLVEVKPVAWRDVEFSYYVDAGSLSVGEDGIIRYVLMARSTDGAENVSFEGIRCRPLEYRVYAVGRPDGSWSGRAGPWRRVFDGRTAQNALSRDYFCPGGLVVRDREEAVRALHRGGHPELARDPR